MKQTLLITALLCLLTVNAFANPVNDKTGKVEPVVKALAYKASGKIKPVIVKNIWKDMPGYDRFGNEIKERARINFRQNAELNRTVKVKVSAVK